MVLNGLNYYKIDAHFDQQLGKMGTSGGIQPIFYSHAHNYLVFDMLQGGKATEVQS